MQREVLLPSLRTDVDHQTVSFHEIEDRSHV
jgi:hypothetical protein